MADEQQSAAKSVLQSIMDKRNEWAKDQPSLGAEIRAMGREAVKDIRNTIHETFFGRGEGPGEPGTPLNPTPQVVTQDLGLNKAFDQVLDGYAARGGNVYGKEQEKGMER